MIFGKIKTFIKNPAVAVKNKVEERRQKEVTYCMNPENYEKISDKRAIKAKYYTVFGKYPDLRHPKTYNEKLQWIKLYDRRPEYVSFVDKYEVKKVVADIIGEKYIIPTYGVWDRAEDIDFDALPDKFVLKCTHDSESVTICKNKAEFDREKAIEHLNRCLKRSMFLFGREWPYKHVKPRIIAEKYLQNEDGSSISDYKFFCFDGEVKTMLIVSERFEHGSKLDYFALDGTHLPFTHTYPNAAVPPAFPKNFELMKSLAEKLSAGYPHIRPDFYECNGEVYFGELTFFTGSGFLPFQPEEWDYTFGSWIKLPRKKIKAN